MRSKVEKRYKVIKILPNPFNQLGVISEKKLLELVRSGHLEEVIAKEPVVEKIERLREKDLEDMSIDHIYFLETINKLVDAVNKLTNTKK